MAERGMRLTPSPPGQQNGPIRGNNGDMRILSIAWIVSLLTALSLHSRPATCMAAEATSPVYGVKQFAPDQIAAVLATGSGISGPGKPFVGDGKPHGLAELSGILPPIKPIWGVHMRDTLVILGGDGNYYLTGSTGDNIWNYNDGVEIWRSSDLKSWTYLGLVWSIEKDGGWEKLWREKNHKPIRSIWAPELHYIHHNYYICFGMPPGGMSILKSTTGKPEGPYVHATDPNKPLLGGIGPLPDSFQIDPTLFEDDDGKVYFTWGPGRYVARMKDDLSDFAEPLRRVTISNPDLDPTHHDKPRGPGGKDYGLTDFGFEGATMFKANGKYYFGSTDRYEGRYSMCVGISDNPYGPYHDRHETVPCNGGTGFFHAKDGSWYTTVMGGADNQMPWNEMPGIVKVEFDAKGLIHPAKAQPDFILATTQPIDTADEPGRFKPDWDSITSQYKVPDWYRDAKFGIFIHWGVYSVPAYHDEWYPRWMYMSDTKSRGLVYDYHIATYGPQTKFGYKDFIPSFKAGKWDPNQWAAIFKESGARYIVPVAEHHDGFSMYDSAINAWNALKMGPKRDIIGELAKAIRSQGMHFCLSSHRAEHWWFFSGGRDFPSDVRDPKYASLYGPAQAVRGKLDNPTGQAFLEDWLARCDELVDKYQPDLVYFDVVGSWSPSFQPYLKLFAAHYYNQADALGKGVVINYKDHIMPPGAGVLDFERDVSDVARPDYWQTDTSVGQKSWSYIQDEAFKSPKQLINEFVDVVSKNGNYLLNIGPKADGTIPDEPRAILRAFGAWLKINGEAIYGSRPAALAGEGPTHPTPKGPGRDSVEAPYTAADFRFTKQGNTLYAIALDWPAAGDWKIRSLAKGAGSLVTGDVQSVDLLGCPDKLKWTQSSDGLTITPPAARPCDNAYVFKIGAIAK
jgi:alpha-L-fucosidase